MFSQAFCPVISGDVGALVDADGVRLFRRAADGLFAWTVLQPLEGDDGPREVVSQGRLQHRWERAAAAFLLFSPPVFHRPAWKCTC